MGRFGFGDLLTGYANLIVENKTHSKIKDIERGPWKAKLEFTTTDFSLGQGTLYLTEYEIMLEFYQHKKYKETYSLIRRLLCHLALLKTSCHLKHCC